MFTAGEVATDCAGLKIPYPVDSVTRLAKFTCPSVDCAQVFTFRADCHVLLADSIPTHSTKTAVIGTGSLSAGCALDKVL